MDIAYVSPGNKNRTKMWWDLENVAIPRDLQLAYLFPRIKHSLDMRGFHGSLEIKAYVAEDRSKKVVEGVEVVSLGLPRPKHNAADSAIVGDIVKFCDRKERVGEPVNILIASGDKDVMLQAYSKSKKRNRSIIWLGVSVDAIEDPMPVMTALWTWRSFLLMKEEAPPKVPLIEYNELEYRNVGPMPWTAEEMKGQVKRQKRAAKEALKDAKEALKEDEASDEEARDVGQEVNVSKKKRARELVPKDEVNVSRKKKRASELDPEE